MHKLSDSEIRQIVKKATLLQKFGSENHSSKTGRDNPEMRALYDITDELGLPRKYVYEAYIERAGIPIQEPFVIDNQDFNSTEIVGFAKGTIDKELLNELKAEIEYHFNTLGTITHRRDKKVWKAKPVGPSKLIASSNSPEVEFEHIGNSTKINVHQSLKTLNKLYLPAIATAFGGFMLFAAVLFNRTGNDVAPPLIISMLIFLASGLYTRFVNGRRKKRKKNLQHLTETLQEIIERRLKSSVQQEKQFSASAQIEIPEYESKSEEAGQEAGSSKKARS